MTQQHIDPTTRFTSLVTALCEQLGGAAVVSPAAALCLVPGIKLRNPDNAAAQRICANNFPFPVVKLGRYPAVLVTDIASTLLGITDAPEAKPAGGAA